MQKIEIINRALTKLGANTIISLDENSIECEVANRTYDESLSSLLSELDWNFAIKEAVLTPAKKVSKWRKGNYFNLPADVINITEVSSQGVWKQEGEYIFAEDSEFAIVYVSKCSNETLFPTYFVDALVYKLCADMCYTITNSSEKAAQFLDLYKGEFLPIARTKNARRKSSPILNDGYWVSSFFGGV